MLKLLILLFVLPVFSQVKVQVIDPELDTTPFEGNYQVSRKEETFSSLPSKKERDKLLSQIAATKDWDELKKDLFYMDLNSKKMEQLKIKYPEIPVQELRKLKGKNE
jgi:hypothetical protein